MASAQHPDELHRLSRAAQLAGVTRQQLQYYLMLGLIEPTMLSDGHQRLFDDQAIKKIRMVKELNRGGYPLREIRDIFIAPSKRQK